MRLQTVQDALNQKNIRFEYTEEDGCGSLDFMFRGLKSMCGNITMESGVQRQISMRQAEVRILRAIMKKRLPEKFCHGRI